MSRDQDCLSYWFPLLESAGLPVPRTEIVRTSIDLTPLLDGKEPDGFRDFLDDLRRAAEAITPDGPWFLRTGQGSGKHSWRSCCDLRDLGRLGSHVAALVEWSETVDMLGLPTNVWAVRERLPVKPIVTLPNYGDMPLVREVRGFVRDGEVQCVHPYWPSGAIREGFGRGTMVDVRQVVRKAWALTQKGRADIDRLLVAAAKVLPGYWSVDLLSTNLGWYVTDAALGEWSFHWPSCPLSTDEGVEKFKRRFGVPPVVDFENPTGEFPQ